jgi:hypothetical protein
VDWCKFTDVSEAITASIVRATQGSRCLDEQGATGRSFLTRCFVRAVESVNDTVSSTQVIRDGRIGMSENEW